MRHRARFDRKWSTKLKVEARTNVEKTRRIAIGVDIGGTFTDVILIDESYSVYIQNILPNKRRDSALTVVVDAEPPSPRVTATS